MGRYVVRLDVRVEVTLEGEMSKKYAEEFASDNLALDVQHMLDAAKESKVVTSVDVESDTDVYEVEDLEDEEEE